MPLTHGSGHQPDNPPWPPSLQWNGYVSAFLFSPHPARIACMQIMLGYPGNHNVTGTEYRYRIKAMKPIPRKLRVKPVSNNAQYSHGCKGVTFQQHQSCISGIWKKYKQNDKDNSDTHRNHLGQTLGRLLLVLSNLNPFQISFRRWIEAFTFLLYLYHRRSHVRSRTENLTALETECGCP